MGIHPKLHESMSMFSRIQSSFRRLGYRGFAAKAMHGFADWVDASSLQRSESNVPKQSAIAMSEDGQMVPSLISPAYIAFQKMPAQVISRYIETKGLRILEIGGAQVCISGKAFLDAGAAQVVVTGLDHIEQEYESNDQRLIVLRADGRNLLKHFEPCSFDVVFGLSIIEHIPEPELFLQQVQAVLKPGGIALFEGDPLWSSANGHHLWVASWAGDYQGRSSANYLFSPLGGVSSTNPIPEWGHLLMTEAEMERSLQAKSLPPNDIACILDWIYHSPNINRLSTSGILEAYTTSGLLVLEASGQRQEVPSEILTRLRELHGEGCDYGLAGLMVVLVKPS